MKRYIKDNKVRKPEQIVIIKDGFQTFNPTEEMLLEEGWVEYIESAPSEEELLDEVKKEKITLINKYDNSFEINQCVIRQGENEFYYWANKSERSSLKTAIQDCLTMGIETYRLDLRELGISFNIPCEAMLQMLAALEVYAIQCYNKTTDHIFNINNMTDLAQLETYDFTQGYPQKLVFAINA